MCQFICRNSIETALEEDAPGLLQVLISRVVQLCLRIWIAFILVSLADTS